MIALLGLALAAPPTTEVVEVGQAAMPGVSLGARVERMIDVSSLRPNGTTPSLETNEGTYILASTGTLVIDNPSSAEQQVQVQDLDLGALRPFARLEISGIPTGTYNVSLTDARGFTRADALTTGSSLQE